MTEDRSERRDVTGSTPLGSPAADRQAAPRVPRAVAPPPYEQLSLAAVAVATRKAIDQVDEHADPTWKSDALQAVKVTCLALPEFISDDVWRVGQLRPTREDRALGPVMMQAKKEGWCVKTDRVRPSLRSHLSGKPVWRSLLKSEEDA